MQGVATTVNVERYSGIQSNFLFQKFEEGDTGGFVRTVLRALQRAVKFCQLCVKY